MSLQNYVIRCYSKDCGREALYKIASRWSDGVTSELKTYSLCCQECLPARFRDSLAKQAACRLAEGETLEAPGIYHVERGRRDRQLRRLQEVEEALARGDNA
ncbi:MAG: hypothetical protein ACJ8F7_04630 [Gemmataceae bacterium]